MRETPHLGGSELDARLSFDQGSCYLKDDRLDAVGARPTLTTKKPCAGPLIIQKIMSLLSLGILCVCQKHTKCEKNAAYQHPLPCNGSEDLYDVSTLPTLCVCVCVYV